MLVASAINKRFGATIALEDVHFEAEQGEIHAVLGENGAGKTTLMNIIAGRMRPDSGSVTLDGVPLTVGDSGCARRAGIAAVYQSPLLFERMTWEENLALGFDPRPTDLDAVAAKAAELARGLGFSLPPPRSTVERCSMSERVRLEIIRALAVDPRVMILDEPTSLLGPGELDSFLAAVRRLRASGRSVLIVTHKLDEAFAVADRVTVLRQGRVVFSAAAKESSVAELARLMIGEADRRLAGAASTEKRDEVLLELDGLTLADNGRPVLSDISLKLRSGEIAGIAGVDGNGQVELVETLAGARRSYTGVIKIAGARLAEGRLLLAVIPQNRDLDGLILDMELWENLLLAPALRERFAAGLTGRIDRERAIAFAAELIARYRIVARSLHDLSATLSGGNRQRLQVARALESRPRVIVAHNVTRGLDPAATADIHGFLREFAAAGNAVLLVSSDLDELFALCDRLDVISGGGIHEVSPNDRTPERLGLLMAGASR